MRILVATHNQGKLREFARLLDNLGIEWLTLDDAGITTDIAETGATFEDNARLKAGGYAALSGLITLADDSGLEVDLLNGEPGVYSARYGGSGTTAEDRYRLLLRKLEGVADDKRTARFRCVIAIAVPGEDMITSSGACEGVIIHEPRGVQGFGYDPVFYLPEQGKTMAELDPELKNQISHRAVAVRAIRPMLEDIIQRKE